MNTVRQYAEEVKAGIGAVVALYEITAESVTQLQDVTDLLKTLPANILDMFSAYFPKPEDIAAFVVNSGKALQKFAPVA